MITRSNLVELLKILGFRDERNVFRKSFNDSLYLTIEVDFKAETIIYPEAIKINDATTCNFAHPENFVVLECVVRLLEKGYRPEHIELEKRWNLGHDSKGGKADICICDETGNMLLIIECKTYGSKYSDAKKELIEDGGQLFSYWQQERHTKWLALYASDLKDGEIVFENDIINCSDDNNLLLLAEKDDTIKLFKNAGTVEEKYAVWRETYGQTFYRDLFFGSDSVAYQIGVRPLRKKDLRDFTPEDKIVNRFEEILRHNNVSDKENAFNRLIALFICKLVDEIGKDDDAELEFQYKQGIDTYETLQDRLQKLHQKGMNDFMKEKIFYVPNDYAEKLVQQYSGQRRKAMIQELQNTIRILKFYTNNDFSFKDVHNEELFYQNGKVVVEVVQLFENYRIVYPSKHQFLGDLFEQLLNKGFKQNEGQFFTPMPITRFIWDALPLDNIIQGSGKYTLPKIIDYACGAGHFLTEAVEAVNAALVRHRLAELARDNSWVEKNIYGVEKDYRLARVSKISLFMNGAGYGNIIFGDGLDNYPEKQIESGSFDILVANPPYAVKGFKAHFRPKNNQFDLLDKITNDGSEIEVLFVERIAQLLKPEGIAAVILPASILSNSSSSYIGAREKLLENFKIHAIAQFGSKTFGATGTNTVVLFLEKYSEPPKRKELVSDSVAAIQSGRDLTDWEDKEILQAYLAKIEVTAEDYELLLKKAMPLSHWVDHAYFGQFAKAFLNSSEAKNKQKQQSFKKLPQEKQEEWLQEHFYEFILSKEKVKIKFFALVYKQKTLVVTAPSDNEEQKDFLGYDWSNRKGSEGIQIQHPGGRLYNEVDRTAENTIAAAIRKVFSNHVSSVPVLEKFLARYRLQDMIDFSRTEFGIEIQTALKNIERVKYNCPMVKLGNEKLFKISIGQRVLNSELAEDGKLPVYSANVKEPFGYINDDLLKDFSLPSVLWGIDGDWMTNYIAANVPFYPTDHCGVIRVVSDDVLPYYVALILSSVGENYAFSRHNRASTERVKTVAIPLPPRNVQQRIVAECEEINSLLKTAKKRANDSINAISQLYKTLAGVDHVELKRYARFNMSRQEVANLSDDTEVSFIDMPSVSDKGFIERSQNRLLGNMRRGGFTYFRDNDIIIAKITPCMENGKCALATGLTNGIGFGSTEFHTIRCSEALLPKFLFGFLNQEQIRRDASKVMTGSSGHRRVPISFYENLLIPWVDREAQLEIVQKIEKLEEQIISAQAILDSTNSRKQAVLDRYLQ